VRVWRLTRAVYGRDPLLGEGAARSGNRWNSPGERVAYTSNNRSLAVLEMLVHVTRDTVPKDLLLIPVEVPDELVAEATELPADWNRLPYSVGARRLGDRWVEGRRSVGLLVPSVVLPAERNLLINPVHPDARRIAVLKAEAFSFDRRLLR